MNREIRFRIWSKISKTMIYSPFVYYDPSNKEWVFMQYIGVNDKNSKAIYEGDIVKILFKRCGKMICEVKWDIMGFEFFMLIKESEQPAFTMIIKDTPIDIEIIGNQFENPDLLA
jgi:uncharacterized phage protein (TIGR01671 family)